MQRQRHNTKELHCCSQFMQSTSRLPADPSDRQRNSQPKYNPVLLQSHISRMGLIWQEVVSIREGTYAKKYAECFLRYMVEKMVEKSSSCINISFSTPTTLCYVVPNLPEK